MRKNKILWLSLGIMTFWILITILILFLLGNQEKSKDPTNESYESSSIVDTEDNISDSEQNTADCITETSSIMEGNTFQNGEESINDEKEGMDMNNYNEETEFYALALTDEIKERITGISYPDTTDQIEISYEELSYVHILYYNFENEICRGEIVCNQIIAEDLIEIFKELYHAKYPIERVELVDEYNGDDEASMAANNSSCFNYRVISGTTKLSNHSYGLAIDINPFYNPYVTTRNGNQVIQPVGSEPYVDRDADFPYKITEEDLCYQLFIEHGFTWGGNWKNSKDYQHFEYKK